VDVLSERRAKGAEIALLRRYRPLLRRWLGLLTLYLDLLLSVRRLRGHQQQAADLLDADGSQVEARLDAGELVVGGRHRRASAERPRLGRRLQAGLRWNARNALRHGDLGHRPGGVRHRGKRLGRPCPWNRDRLIRPPAAGLAYV